MALEDQFVPEDIEEMDRRFSNIERQYRLEHDRRNNAMGLGKDDPDTFGFTDESGAGLGD